MRVFLTPYIVESIESIAELMHSPLCKHTKLEKFITTKANQIKYT